MRKKLEEYIMNLYNENIERVDICKALADEYELTYSEVEPIVDATLLRMKNMKNRKV